MVEQAILSKDNPQKHIIHVLLLPNHIHAPQLSLNFLLLKPASPRRYRVSQHTRLLSLANDAPRHPLALHLNEVRHHHCHPTTLAGQSSINSPTTQPLHTRILIRQYRLNPPRRLTLSLPPHRNHPQCAGRSTLPLRTRSSLHMFHLHLDPLLSKNSSPLM